MLTRARQFVAVFGLCLILPGVAVAQVNLQPTPDPVITADRETWYLNGSPITVFGNIYYPAGAQVHFNRYEMIRSGSFQGVPLYTRTWLEPYSVVFLPLNGGLMQPYERRRTGDVAGTVGSMTPSFPVGSAAEQANAPLSLQAAAPPTYASPIVIVDQASRDVGALARQTAETAVTAPADQPVGTTGVVAAPAAPVRTRIETARRPQGINGVFIEYEGRRWFASGTAVEYEAAQFRRVGDHRGFGVYERTGESGALYVSLVDGTAPGLLTPYRPR